MKNPDLSRVHDFELRVNSVSQAGVDSSNGTEACGLDDVQKLCCGVVRQRKHLPQISQWTTDKENELGQVKARRLSPEILQKEI